LGGENMTFKSTINKDKADWLNSVGAQECKPPWVCFIPINGKKFNYSLKYLENTSLDELKTRYFRNLKIRGKI
jgi:hypothetical protein